MVPVSVWYVVWTLSGNKAAIGLESMPKACYATQEEADQALYLQRKGAMEQALEQALGYGDTLLALLQTELFDAMAMGKNPGPLMATWRVSIAEGYLARQLQARFKESGLNPERVRTLGDYVAWGHIIELHMVVAGDTV